jgi:hypothetical protein
MIDAPRSGAASMAARDGEEPSWFGPERPQAAETTERFESHVPGAGSTSLVLPVSVAL